MPVAELLRLGAARTIVRWGDPILHTPALPVTDFGPELQELLADMFATNTAAHGAGLAAQQIGVNLAVFVYDCPDEDWNRRTGVLCNPRLQLPQGRDRRLVSWDEGCLSLPGANMELTRPETATCSGQDQYGEPVTITAGGVLGAAACNTRPITSTAWSSVTGCPRGNASNSTGPSIGSPTGIPTTGPDPLTGSVSSTAQGRIRCRPGRSSPPRRPRRTRAARRSLSRPTPAPA